MHYHIVQFTVSAYGATKISFELSALNILFRTDFALWLTIKLAFSWLSWVQVFKDVKNEPRALSISLISHTGTVSKREG